METRVAEVAAGVHQLTTTVPGAPLAFNQYLITGDEPALFHAGMRSMFPVSSDAVGRVLLIGVEEHFPQQRLGRGREVPVEQTEAGVRLEFLGEQRRELPVVDHAMARPIDDIRRDLQIDVENDAEQPVAADDQAEQLRLVRSAHVLDRSVREHDAHGANRPAD